MRFNIANTDIKLSSEFAETEYVQSVEASEDRVGGEIGPAKADHQVDCQVEHEQEVEADGDVYRHKVIPAEMSNYQKRHKKE